MVEEKGKAGGKGSDGWAWGGKGKNIGSRYGFEQPGKERRRNTKTPIIGQERRGARTG